jgi:hypothetical protein
VVGAKPGYFVAGVVVARLWVAEVMIFFFAGVLTGRKI